MMHVMFNRVMTHKINTLREWRAIFRPESALSFHILFRVNEPWHMILVMHMLSVTKATGRT
eukprot:7525076-Karenia_brevis.AAC.1